MLIFLYPYKKLHTVKIYNIQKPKIADSTTEGHKIGHMGGRGHLTQN